MRGKRRLREGRPRRSGLIPAYAGKTSPSLGYFLALGAHPRVCGENKRRPLKHHRARGSSPRMRGKQHTRHGLHKRPRLIPAYAGKTFSRSFMMSRRSAHPRVCGENEARAGPKTPPQGSSPRMRGKRGRLARSRRARGLIPAYAGKTLSGG